MKPQIGIDQCRAFINCHMQPVPAHEEPATQDRPPTITISRQSGAGGHSVAVRLAEILQARAPANTRPWTVFDRNLVDQVLEDHHLPKSLARFLGEERRSELQDTIDELVGLHPHSDALARQVSETVLRLADLGNTILIGRGATFITRKLPHTFHVRLVGSLDRRVERVAECQHISRDAAREMVRREDAARRGYVRRFFGQEVDDPLHYHLVLNTDWVPFEEAARVIATMVRAREGVRQEECWAV